jgi:Domain of unknown function (DUF5979)
MHMRHLRRGGITALVVGILLLLGAPIAALADEPASSASEETPSATEVTTPPTAPEEPPATVPPVEEPPVVEPPVEEPPVTAVPPDTAPDADVPSDSVAADRTAKAEAAPAPVPLGAPDILGQIQQANLKAAHVGAMNPGFQTGTCPDNPFNDDTFGWHFILPGNSTTFVTLSATFQNAGTITQFVSVPTGKHAYVWTPGPDTLLGATATVEGPQTVFNLSHVCPGTTNPVGSLSVIKAIQGTPGGPFTINVTCTLNQETVVDTDLVFNGAGQQQVGNIPAGATCNVEETDDGGATTVEYSADPPQNIVIVANEVAGPVTVTNIFGEEPEVGSLAVTKEIEGTPPVGAQFLVHVTCTLDTDTVVDQDLPLFTNDGQTETITGIPAGAECEVEETGNFGALVSYDPDPPVVTIVENEQSDVTVTNTYELGGLRVTKVVVGGTGTPAPGTQFSVRVRCEFADVEVVDETLVFGVAGGEDSIDGIPAGATCDVTEPGTGGASGVTITPDSVVIVGESTEDVTVTNIFTSTSPASVVPVTPATPSGVRASGSSGSSGSLAFTGSNAASLATTGLALLIGGGAALWFARRRSPFLSR